MAGTILNQVKMLLVLEAITEQGIDVRQNNSFTVQHFSYTCCRRRNDSGIPYGPTLPAYLDFTVKVVSGNNGKVFFERMQTNETFPYSFLFNASFTTAHQLSEYDDAMVASGYVVDVEEEFESAPGPDGTTEQMLIHVKLLISNLAYLGQDRTLDLTITKD